MTETTASAYAAASTLFLGHNGEWWDSWLITFAVIAGLAATGVGVTTAASIISHKREAIAAENALARYKLETGRQLSEANAAGDTAKREAAKANEAVARANERAAALEKEASLASLEQARLKQIVKWRILTPDQLQILSAKLQQGGRANITYAANDPEALFFWTQISKAFPQPAWKMIAQARTYEGTFLAGIFIYGPDTPATRAIKEAFTAAGIAFGVDNPGDPHIFVGDPGIPDAPTVFIASRFPTN